MTTTKIEESEFKECKDIKPCYRFNCPHCDIHHTLSHNFIKNNGGVIRCVSCEKGMIIKYTSLEELEEKNIELERYNKRLQDHNKILINEKKYLKTEIERLKGD